MKLIKDTGRQSVKYELRSFSFSTNSRISLTVSCIPRQIPILYSVRNDFTGFATTALIAWKLMVTNAMNNAVNAVNANTSPISSRHIKRVVYRNLVLRKVRGTRLPA